MENYSLLMGDSSVDEDGGGVDGEAFRGHFPIPAACREQRLLSPRSWLRDGGGSGRRRRQPEGGAEEGRHGPPIGRRGPRPGRAALWGGGPQPPLASSPSRTSSSQKPKLEGIVAKSHSRLCGAENTREKRALRRAGIRRGNSLPEGEIDAIVTVIELDIISIIITIISIIITAISTAAHRHRCNN
ncbi:hypothetical protein QYE76_023851 [Lolium multiflorum]|uniref:Uncharacterized protein n=1 Tax=Lolium multiflorum TaxID=4521 RepID=A0AAD8VT64_LOLMU|nr:hypothetical protein QYE76_023851 [Lolium multiflorum]